MRRPTIVWAALLAAASCTAHESLRAPSVCPASTLSATDRVAHVPVQRHKGSPNATVVVRDGDPRPAVAMVVATRGGSWSSAALAAVVEARMQARGLVAQTRADGHGFRVLLSIDDAAQVRAFVVAARAALAAPVISPASDTELASRRLAALRRRPLDGAALASVADCTGELGLLPEGASGGDPGNAAGAAELDRARRAAFDIAHVAFGAAGPSSVGAALADAVAAQEWPSGGGAPDAWPKDDAGSAYASASRAPGTARVDIALYVDRAEAAIEAAARAGRPKSALVERLASLAVPFRASRVAGVARERGGCLSAVLESVRPIPSGVEEAAGLAAAVARQELERERARFDEQAAVAAQRTESLGSEATRAARAARDPREAAALAAWWSLTDRGSAEPRLAWALGVAPPPLDPRDPKSDLKTAMQTAGGRFWSAFGRAQASYAATVIEHRERAEPGQGELWVLLASPCGTCGETMANAGETALAVLSDVAEHADDDASVTVEPWIAPDAVGIVAHAPRARGEAPAVQAMRVADQAARSLLSLHVRGESVARARTRLLEWLGDGVSSDGRALFAAAVALAPAQPSSIAPLGSYDTVLGTRAESVALRSSALAAGPLRAAVLADVDARQADVAVRTIDRWITRRSDPTKACPATPDTEQPKAAAIAIDLGAKGTLAQVVLAVPAPVEGKPERIYYDLTAAALRGASGMPAGAEPRLAGGRRAAAFVVDIRAPDAGLDAALARVRDVIAKMRKGGLTQKDLDRALDRLRREDLEASYDPRRRLASLFEGPAPPPPAPNLEAWRGWIASAFAEDRVVVVVARPKRPPP